jgi:GxxExxY protein
MAQNSSYHGVMYKHSELTEVIIGAFFAVYNTLGYGFLEKVYVNALKLEFERRGLKVASEFPIAVRYLGQAVGEYYADILVNDLIIVEVKATKTLLQEHEAQLLNYLKATPYEVGLLLNFGPKPEQKRRSFDNHRKEWWLAEQTKS